MWRGGGSQSVSTPKWFFNAINNIWKFKFDVAADHENSKCRRFYSELENGLTQPWSKTNWCNPLFNNIGPWLQKADEEAKLGNVTVMLIPMKTECKYWRLVINNPRVSCFALNKKIAFEGFETGFPLALCLLVFHPEEYVAPHGTAETLSKLQIHPWGGAPLVESAAKRERMSCADEYICDFCGDVHFDSEGILSVHESGLVIDVRHGGPARCSDCNAMLCHDVRDTLAA
jgi:site-specific DNA-methyltransferase (adenine-specific)